MREPNQSPQKKTFDDYVKDMEEAHKKAKRRRRIEGAVVIAVIFSTFAIFAWLLIWANTKSACSDADLINRVYGTEYTCSDILWSKDIIEQIQFNSENK